MRRLGLAVFVVFASVAAFRFGTDDRRSHRRTTVGRNEKRNGPAAAVELTPDPPRADLPPFLSLWVADYRLAGKVVDRAGTESRRSGPGGPGLCT